MIRDQKSSGLTIKEWCLKNHISEHCFYYRQHKLRQDALSGQEPRFMELLPPASAATNLENLNSTASIVHGTFRVDLTNEVSEELLAKIIRVMTHAQ